MTFIFTVNRLAKVLDSKEGQERSEGGETVECVTFKYSDYRTRVDF